MKSAFFMQKKGSFEMADNNTSTTTPAGGTSKPTSSTPSAGLTSVVKPAFNNPASSPIMKAAEPAKDPKGMFDWSDAKPYVVKQGESLFDVAQKFSVALQQLRYFNHINKVTMKVKEGQTVYIPNHPINVPYGA